MDVAYGARILQRRHEHHHVPLCPTLQFEPFDRAALERGNFIDTGVIAHRSNLEGVRFDESLPACEDWDLVLTLTREKDAYALPVLASAYRMTAPNRITLEGRMRESELLVRAKHEGSRARYPPGET